MSKMSNVRALQGLISPIQFVEIVDWNKLRNGLVCNEELEDAMLREELQEYFDATELVDKLDAVADYLFVAGGTVTKYAYDFDEAPSIVDELDVILSDFAGRCEVAGIDAQIVGKLINDALGVVIEANKQKSSVKREDGKVTKPADFIPPEEELQKLIDAAIAYEAPPQMSPEVQQMFSEGGPK